MRPTISTLTNGLLATLLCAGTAHALDPAPGAAEGATPSALEQSSYERATSSPPNSGLGISEPSASEQSTSEQPIPERSPSKQSTSGALSIRGTCAPPGEGRLAIIIDDLGYNWERGRAITELPAPVTVAIIPGTPHGPSLARLASENGKEVMVHMPMTSSHAEVSDPLLLSDDLSIGAFDALIDEAVSAVPGATGMNNHMGSALTANRAAMTRFMARLKALNLFFIDSRTSTETVAAEVAEELNLANASRSVFLDNERDRIVIRQHLADAVAVAQSTGYAIAIGHPYPQTLDVLSEELTQLPRDVTLTPASEIARCARTQSLTSIP